MIGDTPPWRLLAPDERSRYWRSQWRLGVPGLSVLLLIFLMTAPLLVPVPVFPHLALLGVFVWASFQPGLMPPWLAFALGLVADLAFAQPLGLDGTLFALAAATARLAGARQGQPSGLFDWRLAIFLVLGFELGAWALMDLAGRSVPLLPLAWQLLTTIAAYPLVVAFCAVLQRRSFGRGLVR